MHRQDYKKDVKRILAMTAPLHHFPRISSQHIVTNIAILDHRSVSKSLEVV